MKPRTLNTYKILAVAFTAAGCSSASSSEIAGETPRPVTAQPVAVAPSPTVAPARPMSQDPALLALREELSTQDPHAVMAKPARFQPLCDKDGYPLVGNLMRKSVSYETSTFCSDLRTLAKR